MTAYLSAACLLFVATLCVGASLSPRFHDNAWQALGLALLCVACTARAWSALRYGYVSFEALMMYVGMALYAAGTWVKWAHYHRRRPRKPA